MNHSEKNKNKKILVVDDEILVIKFITAALAGTPYQVSFAENGAGALECLQGGEFDLILTDIRMPDMNGMEFYSSLSNKMPAMADKVIVMTGDTIGLETKHFLEDTRLPYITKPFNTAVLRQTIDHAFELDNL